MCLGLLARWLWLPHDVLRWMISVMFYLAHLAVQVAFEDLNAINVLAKI